MSTQGCSGSTGYADEQIEAMLAARFADAGSVDVDGAIRAGRRRRRRRRSTAAGGVVAGVVGAAAAAALLLPGLPGRTGDTDPAGGGSTSSPFTACSHEPQTCSPEEVDAWITSATGEPVTGSDVFADLPGIPGDTVTYHPFVEGDVRTDLAMSRTRDVDELFAGLATRPSSRRATDDPAITRYSYLPTRVPSESAYTAWGIERTGSRASVLVIFSGPDSAQPSDAEAAELLHGLRGDGDTG